MPKIMVVDDYSANRELLVTLLARRGYRTLAVGDGAEALAVARVERPDLIISDILMPAMDGYEFVRRLRADPRIAGTAVIFYSATYDNDDARALAAACGVRYLLSKPANLDDILQCVHAALNEPDLAAPTVASDFDGAHASLLNENLVAKVAELDAANARLVSLNQALTATNSELARAYDATIEGWSRALDLRDHETEGHSRRVTDLTLCLARALGMPSAEMVHLRRGALLHDIGKMGVPDHILRKPGPLSEDEWAIMRLHPVYAHDLLSPVDFLRPALDIPYCHHEKWDGSGYPRGLARDEIPLPARIFAVADVWDAVRSDRPYRPAWGPEETRDYIRSLAGTHFDPAAVAAFMDVGAAVVTDRDEDAQGTGQGDSGVNPSCRGFGGPGR